MIRTRKRERLANRAGTMLCNVVKAVVPDSLVRCTCGTRVECIFSLPPSLSLHSLLDYFSASSLAALALRGLQ